MTELFHGTWWDLHKKDKPEEVISGRFTRLFPRLKSARFDEADLLRLAEEMTADQEEPRPSPETARDPEQERDPEEDPEITAAYTYLGQFFDHDVTFDQTSHLREFLNPDQIKRLVDFRTPRLDLDSVYGRGPGEQPFMYELDERDRIHMLLGERMSGNPYDPYSRQVPRGPNGRALIGDPRNDENRIVAQLHAVFLRFHNQVAKHLGENASFDEVRQQVRWHYQWVLVTDYLRTVINNETYTSVFPNPHQPVFRVRELQDGLQLMPVEFSAAAFRFGHAMIRPIYRLNTTIERRPIFSGDIHDGVPADDAADLGGFRPIPSDWAIDWQFFIDFEHGANPAETAPLYDRIVRKPQMAYKIDTSLVSPLRHLPHRIAFDPSMLALRNLQRGATTFGLPSGQAVATKLGEKPIEDEKLVIGKATADDPKKPLVEISEGFAGKAPLWAYILSEAQVTSWERADPGMAKDDIPIKLGPVGGRIVAEVFAALLRGDPTSYLRRETQFRPIRAFTRDGNFGLAELINVALGRAP